MEITPELVRNLTKLSRLAVTPEEEVRLEADLKAMVGFFEKLNELDTSGLPEMARPIETVNRLRPDEPRSSLAQSESLSVAVEEAEQQFKVPRVIE
ncbi:MAG: Asp-tRNA(Asn)/Glu-tRNA(Gln) amidotransferase subunit GatC [Meiothermus sp.]|nr:Asp-tRNA(Asn)/Glu-tRNA(Gln) amidotransferase subunit GatC [Meiothermus sp.]